MPGFVIANWKLNKTKKEALEFIHGLQAQAPFKDTHVGVSPAFPYLETLTSALSGTQGISVYAQNVAFAEAGAYTGEVSAPMIKDVGANGVIVGHSERRHVFKENPDWMAQKISQALKQGLLVVYCVGETLKERDSNLGPEVVNRQLKEGLEGLEADLKALIKDKKLLVIAYEPVWAIGTGRNMEPIEAKEAAKAIKAKVGEILEGYIPPVLYGGSVNPKNIEGFSGHPEIDGVLVGGASLEMKSFLPLIRAFEKRIP